MANEEHLALARQGKDVWNRRRQRHPGEPADFSGVDFTQPENKNINFAGFEFGNEADFSKAVFGDLPERFSENEKTTPEGGPSPEGAAVFSHSMFGRDAKFDDATFGNEARFEGVKFNEGASFAGVEFGDKACFFAANFGNRALFAGATFGDKVQFNAVFADVNSFSRTKFGDEAQFAGTIFGSKTQFDGAMFGDRAQFSVAEFKDDARFEGATFGVRAQFEGASFGSRARFDDVTFERGAMTNNALIVRNEVDFTGATFADRAQFVRTKFRDGANFTGAAFGDWAEFKGAMFGEWAYYGFESLGNEAQFKGTVFGVGAVFTGTAFVAAARFEGAVFGNGTNFVDAKFGGEACFEGATLRRNAEFDSAVFHGQADFSAFDNQALENLLANLKNKIPKQSLSRFSKTWARSVRSIAEFRAISFAGARFQDVASFAGRTFHDEVDFAHARFGQPPDFGATKNREHLNWTGAEFRFGSTIRYWTTDTLIVAKLRRLRAIAKEIHTVDADRDLFVLERMAERGILWREWWRGGWLSMLFGWWRPLIPTVLMLIYRTSSNCGRSVSLPLLWMGAINIGLYFFYNFLVPKPNHDALVNLTISSAVPFGVLAKPSLTHSVEKLFCGGTISWPVQALSAGQGLVNVILLFLLGLALRNHFRTR